MVGTMRASGRRFGRGPALVVLAAVLVVTGLPAEAQTPPSSGTADDLLVSDPDGQVFGDRSLLPAPGEEPAGDEVVALRTATTRTFETDVPGVFVTEQFAAPVNVEAGEGWVPIDPTLEAEGDSWANTADRVDVAVAGTADAEELAAVTLPAGASVGFALDGAVGVEADVDGDTAVFTDATTAST